jgi:hypothetical protein
MLEPVRPEAVSPDRVLCLPTFSHFLIINKTSLALSLSLSLCLLPDCAKVLSTVAPRLPTVTVLRQVLRRKHGVGRRQAILAVYSGE